MHMIRSGDNGKTQSLSQIDLFFFSVLLYIDVFLVRETVIVTPFQRN